MTSWLESKSRAATMGDPKAAEKLFKAIDKGDVDKLPDLVGKVPDLNAAIKGTTVLVYALNADEDSAEALLELRGEDGKRLVDVSATVDGRPPIVHAYVFFSIFV